MTDQVAWLLELAIKPGELDNLKDLLAEMVAATEADEPGTLDYEWSIDDEGTTCHIWERYADSAATMVHLGNFGAKFAPRFMAALEPTRMVVYGSPSDDARQQLAGMGAVFMAPAGGFTRSAP